MPVNQRAPFPHLQAEKFRSKAQKEDVFRSHQQYCRYLFYLGRIRAIQLEYSEARDCLQQVRRNRRMPEPAGRASRPCSAQSPQASLPACMPLLQPAACTRTRLASICFVLTPFQPIGISIYAQHISGKSGRLAGAAVASRPLPLPAPRSAPAALHFLLPFETAPFCMHDLSALRPSACHHLA